MNQNDHSEASINIDYDKDSYYVLAFQSKGIKAVNPRSFSWWAFGFPLFFYGYYRRWKATVLICFTTFLFDYLVTIAFEREPIEWYEIIVLCFAGVFLQLWAGGQGKRSKLLSLVSQGWEVVGEYNAKSELDARNQHTAALLAELDSLDEDTQDSQIEDDDIITESNYESILEELENLKPFGDDSDSTKFEGDFGESDKARPVMTGAAAKLEQFSYLRDQGIITEKEFQKKKRKLLKK